VQVGGSPIRPQNGDYYSQVYKIPTTEEITAVLQRVRGYLDVATASRIVAGRGGQEITDFSQPVPGAGFEAPARGAQGTVRFQAMAYEQGVVYSGMLAASEATGDPAYNDYVIKRLTGMVHGLAITPPPAPGANTGGRGGRGGFTSLYTPRSLDDCGAMCASLIQARLANVGPDTTPIINNWIKFIDSTVFRLPDGTIARHIPMPETIWADDMYMGAPALALMGKLTGDKKYFDDAAKQIVQMSARLFRPQKGLYAHGWITPNPDTIDIHWARANGWCALAMADVLDLLPADHPARPAILALFRAHMQGIAERQSDAGLWHQLLDREDSYLETSASAIFVYTLAHGINRGWLSPAFGTQALIGWKAVATRVNDRGQVEGTCTGTNFDLSPMYYYARPVSVDALHGYGPVLLAGAEVLKMLGNPNITIANSVGSIYVSPKPDAPMPWLADGRTSAK
jgi:rhamnogalacturonyl hydrolase YesR